jgi:Leucine-rich repeat (LRR) protein
MKNLKELMISRNFFSSSIPSETGKLTKLENFEAYSNSLTGILPAEIAYCTDLKRIGEDRCSM